MEVPVVDRVGDLQQAVGRFPSLISQLLIEQAPAIFSFWKWGAVILAVYAIVNSLMVRFKIELIRLGKRQSAVTKALLSYSSDEDYDYSSDDDVSVSGSSVNEDDKDEEEEEEEEEEEVKDTIRAPFGSFFDFRVAGSSSFEKADHYSESNDRLPRRFSWSNFVNGKSVVKLWDGVGIGLDLNCSSSGGLLTLHDLNRDDSITSFFPTEICRTPAVSTPSPSLILSAGKDRASNLSLSLADTRLGRQALFANWKASELVNPTVGVSNDALGKTERVRFEEDN